MFLDHRHRVQRIYRAGVMAAALYAFMVTASLARQAEGPDGLMETQREIISLLSGASATPDGKRLRARWSRKQRGLAADILVDFLDARDLKAEHAHYVMPNEHPVLDMFLPAVRGVNIVATLPATIDTDQYVIVGAHYDSVSDSPGANDNASGVAIILSAFDKLRSLDRRNVNFQIVFFDQEEGGSLGSRTFAQDLKQRGVNVHSVHTVDMAGSDGDGDGVMELDAPEGAIADAYQSAANRLAIPISSVQFNSSDHLSFLAEGFAAVCLSEEVYGGDKTPHYHAETDTLEQVDLAYTVRAAMLLSDALTQIAVQ